MQNHSWSSASIASTTPSGDLAPTRIPLPTVFTAWWCRLFTRSSPPP